MFDRIKNWFKGILNWIKNTWCEIVNWIKGLWSKKLLIKAIIYRLLAFFIVFGISMIITGKYEVSLFIGSLELICKLIVYYVYELVWRKIDK